MVLPKDVSDLEELRNRLSAHPGGSLIEFVNKLARNGYHEAGHLYIGQCGGPMEFAEASGRDPIFFRWHKQISTFIEKTLDQILPG